MSVHRTPPFPVTALRHGRKAPKVEAISAHQDHPSCAPPHYAPPHKFSKICSPYHSVQNSPSASCRVALFAAPQPSGVSVLVSYPAAPGLIAHSTREVSSSRRHIPGGLKSQRHRALVHTSSGGSFNPTTAPSTAFVVLLAHHTHHRRPPNKIHASSQRPIASTRVNFSPQFPACLTIVHARTIPMFTHLPFSIAASPSSMFSTLRSSAADALANPQ
jgi:hypothetical protein